MRSYRTYVGLCMMGILASLGVGVQTARAQSRVPVLKHEPIFGVGPRTIWKGGIGFEVGIAQDRTARNEQLALEYEILYGLTESWAVTLLAEQALNGMRTVFSLRSKFRFFKKDVRGGVYHTAVLGGIRMRDSGGGLDGLMMGLSGAYEGRRWLLFMTARQRIRQARVRDSILLYDVALGVRPVKTTYYQPDLTLMAELNGQLFFPGHRLLGALGFWLTYRNWAFKPGLQWMLFRTNNIDEGKYRWVGSVEVHF